MKRRRNTQLGMAGNSEYGALPPVPMLPVESISLNATNLFANLFNLLPTGLHTFSSVSPSLEEITFTANKSAVDIMWSDNFDDFMDSFVCRLALTGKAILIASSFNDSELGKSHPKTGIPLVIQAWHISGDASHPASFSEYEIRKWYKKFGRKRPDNKIIFVKGHLL